MAETTENKPEISAEQRLENIKTEALRRIMTQADALRRMLRDFQDTAVIKLGQLDEGKGNMLAGPFGGGPFGHQMPSDVTNAATRLKEAGEFAYLAGATDEEILTAQKGWGL